MANILQADGITELLKTYPNQRFIDTLMSNAIYEARVGFQGIQTRNHHDINLERAIERMC